MPLLLDFSPENNKKRKQYSIFDVLDDSDIEALTDRFQKQNQMEALESFKLKMDADTFAWALKYKKYFPLAQHCGSVSWAVLNKEDPSGEDCSMVKKSVAQYIKQMNPSFLKQLNAAIRNIKQST